MSEVQEAATGNDESMELVSILEALLFAAGDPVTLEEIREAVPRQQGEQVEAALQHLEEAYDESHGLQIVQVAGGYRMVTRSAQDRYIRALLRQRNRRRLGRASLETLAVVAYRQPVTGPEVSEIRGKDSTAVLKGLLDKQLVRITGRKKVVGKPFLYGTTRNFLLHFGLNSLDDLPAMSEFEEVLQQRMELLEEASLPLEDPSDEFPEAPGEPDAEERSTPEEQAGDEAAHQATAGEEGPAEPAPAEEALAVTGTEESKARAEAGGPGVED